MGLFATILGQAEKAAKEDSAAQVKAVHGRDSRARPGWPAGGARQGGSPQESEAQSREVARGTKSRDASIPATARLTLGASGTGPFESRPGAATEVEALRAEKDARRRLEPRQARTGGAGSAASAETDEASVSKKPPSKAGIPKSDEARDALAAQLADPRALPTARGEDRPRVASSKEEASDPRRIEADRGRPGTRDEPGLAAKIQVTDLRKAQARREATAAAEAQAAEIPSSSRKEEASKSREIILDLAKAGPAPERTAEPRSLEGTPRTGDFATLLAERLRDSGNGEIVQGARIILKDGDSGTIRMRLNPPELGNVKIELNLADNSIRGRIVVESDEAKSAFEKGLADLRDAFSSGGFESASLEVSVGTGNQGAGGGARDGTPAPFWSERRRDVAFDPAARTMPEQLSRADGAVDMFA